MSLLNVLYYAMVQRGPLQHLLNAFERPFLIWECRELFNQFEFGEVSLLSLHTLPPLMLDEGAVHSGSVSPTFLIELHLAYSLLEPNNQTLLHCSNSSPSICHSVSSVGRLEERAAVRDFPGPPSRVVEMKKNPLEVCDLKGLFLEDLELEVLELFQERGGLLEEVLQGRLPPLARENFLWDGLETRH